ncbi:uncharacterized protein TNCV_2513601 [Trichonephila clavipes]|nr:uncharacterized protein TNCV_2513601 [Trichonephila clavipes]
MYYEPEYPYTIRCDPIFGVHVPRSFGKTVIVFTSHLDLTWDKEVDLKFFRVGNFPSCQVWEVYEPKDTEAYILELTHCTRLADVHVTWLARFHHQGKPLPIELIIATILSDGTDPKVRGITGNHAGLTSTPKELRSNSHENERLRLVHYPLSKSVPVEYLPFRVRGKLSQLYRRGLMLVKGTEQQKNFQELGVFAMSLETSGDSQPVDSRNPAEYNRRALSIQRHSHSEATCLL